MVAEEGESDVEQEKKSSHCLVKRAVWGFLEGRRLSRYITCFGNKIRCVCVNGVRPSALSPNVLLVPTPLCVWSYFFGVPNSRTEAGHFRFSHKQFQFRPVGCAPPRHDW